MNTVIFSDLSSVTTSDDGRLECALPNYYPETFKPFSNKNEILNYVNNVRDKEFFWIPKLSDEEKAAIAFERKATEIRFERNRLLAETDWTQVADAPVDKETWATYRQELRDIPQQEGFPWEVQWPEQP